jgi:RHS repeat-associated protein
MLTASPGSLVNPLQYMARESDAEPDLYYYRARYYDPQTGRFLSEDPIGFKGGINFYGYVGNNASSHTDPEGKGVVDCLAALADLTAATARVALRTAAITAHGGRPDPGHIKALQQAVNQLEDALAKVKKHCSCYGPLVAEIAAAIAAAEAALEEAAPYIIEFSPVLAL